MRLLTIFLSTAVIIVGVAFFPVRAFSQDVINSPAVLEFQVVQNQFIFDHDTVKNASLILQDDGTFKGLFVELKPTAATDFERITTVSVGKHLNIFFNKKVITSSVLQTPLGGSLLISGISKVDAQEFINSLKSVDELKKLQAR